MSFETILGAINEQAKNVAPLGDTLKFKIDDNSLFIDGTGDSNVVSTDDNEASCTISCSAETLTKLKDGSLNPMMAVMSGKVKIKGDMGLAMKLQSLL